MNASPTIGQLAEAMSLVQSEMEAAKKDADNPFYKSKYADLAAIWEVAREPIGRHGITILQTPETVIDIPGVIITTLLAHKSGEWISSALRLVPAKDDPQSLGSCVTYGRRYALAAVLGISAEPDDDGNAASGKKPEAVTEAAKTFTKPKPTAVKADAAAVVQAIAPTPLPPVNVTAVPEAIEYIDHGTQVNFATTFREALPIRFRAQAEVLRHEWLSIRKFIDENGNPSSKMIPKKDYVVIRAMATAWAKEHTETEAS